MKDPSELSIEELDAAPISEELGKLLDERAAALARDPNQKKYTLQEIAVRRNVKL